ncbi:hypothetical protein SAMN05216272_107322 [Pseudomonas panipatensis]|uniref:Uncharacterized protein n=1 Tax=Pseudomonas panipatensis TaxID=428992 RepID=A0A1G8JF20_9PSED|nr:hypothetical protein SAMN05216272_107322 [Pseudomonas panipatensis]SMP51001.1 hypothetical protein SAMN06295951_102554 [Pseudomonas panipatensis]
MHAEGIQRQLEEIEFVLCMRYRWLRVPAWRPLVADIARQAATEALKPIIFRQVLRRHTSRVLEGIERCSDIADRQRLIDGLCSVLVFLNGRKLSWESFSELGHSLSLSPASPDLLVSLGQLMSLAEAINVVLGYANDPPRPRFCAMCWRFVLSGEKYCRTHRVPVSGTGWQGRQGHDSYWSGRKLLPQFNDGIRKLSSQARKEQLRSHWKEVVEAAQIVPWLERHRPLVWQFVMGHLANLEGGAVLPVIIQALDEHNLEVGALREQRAAFHRSLLDDRKAAFDLLLRAEAWLGAAAERRAGWGGGREGAGRPRKATNSAL